MVVDRRPTPPRTRLRARVIAEPEVTSSVELAADARDAIHEGLAGVPRSGTAATPFRGFDLHAVPLLAKTGTAQVDGRADTALFAGPPRPIPATPSLRCWRSPGSAAAASAIRQLLESVYGPTPTSAGAPGAAPG